MEEKKGETKPGRKKKDADDVVSASGSVYSIDIKQAKGLAIGDGARVIDTSGGAYIEGTINTGGGDFVGRDQIKTTGLGAADVAQLFEQIYALIGTRPNTNPEDKADLKTDVQELQAEVIKGDKADEIFLSRRLRNIQRMAPDILEVVIATLTNPVAGFSLVVIKVAQQMKAATGGSS